MDSEEQVANRESQSALAARRPDDWQALGEAFEAMGKAGLALTIGFTVAAGVCKMAQQGKLKLPDFLGMVGLTPPAPAGKEERPTS